MNIQLNLLADYLAKSVSKDAPHYRQEYDKLIAERDTSDVWRQFAIWLLVDPDDGVIRFTKPDSKEHAAIKNVAYLYSTHCQDRKIWKEAAKVAKAAWNDTMFAEHAADAAVEAAYEAAKAAAAEAEAAYYARAARAARAALAAARAAEHAADAWAAYYAAYYDGSAAADAAADAAWAAVHAADKAAAAYYAARAAAAEADKAAAGAAAWAEAHRRMADKLLELLQSAPPKEAK